MGDRDLILQNLPGGSPATLPSPPPKPETQNSRLDELWSSFEARLQALGGRSVSREDLRPLEGRKAWLDEDVSLTGVRLERPADIWEAEVGITRADCAIAESGSLLLATGPGRSRMASLAPELHIAIVRRQDIVATLDEGLARLGLRTSVLVTGSSRTADIEGVLVRGVHGPKEVWVFVE